jgi:hypothetical protein
MLGLLARVVIGVALAGTTGAVAYGVYKMITRDSAKNEINSRIEDDDKFKDAFKAKYKEKSANNETFTFEVLDEWDEPLGDVDLNGDELSSDIQIGDEIILKDAC